MESSIVDSGQVSDTENAKLTIEAINSGTPEEELQLDIMHRPDSMGSANVAYLVFGVPGTSSYSFYDLNNLPDGIKVCVTIESNGTTVSRSEFSGTNGNAPQAVEA